MLLLLPSPAHLEQAQRPCHEQGSCGANFNVFPDDPRLRYDGYAHLTVERERARMDRSPLGAEGSDARLSNPGARLSFTTDAHRIQVILEYTGHYPCTPGCPRTAAGACYEPKPCANQCEMLVEVDGVPTRAAHTNLVGQEITHDHKTRDLQGEIKLHLGHPPDTRSPPQAVMGAQAILSIVPVVLHSDLCSILHYQGMLSPCSPCVLPHPCFLFPPPSLVPPSLVPPPPSLPHPFLAPCLPAPSFSFAKLS